MTRIRPSVRVAHIRFLPKATQQYKQGAYDAVDGYGIRDPHHPDYRKGHTFGMALREVAEAADEEFKKGRRK